MHYHTCEHSNQNKKRFWHKHLIEPGHTKSKSVREKSNHSLDLFQPSIYIAIFPYLFIASFPLFGIVLVSRWIMRDDRKK
jgi:hypothetical protein